MLGGVSLGHLCFLALFAANGKGYDPDKAVDYAAFEGWLRCYSLPGMKSLCDANNRTIWFQVGTKRMMMMDYIFSLPFLQLRVAYVVPPLFVLSQHPYEQGLTNYVKFYSPDQKKGVGWGSPTEMSCKGSCNSPAYLSSPAYE